MYLLIVANMLILMLTLLNVNQKQNIVDLNSGVWFCTTLVSGWTAINHMKQAEDEEIKIELNVDKPHCSHEFKFF